VKQRHWSEPQDWYTPQEVGNMAGGFTAQFIREEIKAGELQADYCLSKRGKLGRYRISRANALAYTLRLRSGNANIANNANINSDPL
jgi:hypothetical protein